MTHAATAPPARLPPFRELLWAKLNPNQRRTLVRTEWYDRLVSVWAPVSVLALCLLAYMAVVEPWPCSAGALQPVMQGIGALTFIWWAILVVMRFTRRRWNDARKARYAAEDALAHVGALVRRARRELKPKALDEVIEQSAVLVQSIDGSGPQVRTAIKALEAAVDKHLARFHQGGVLSLSGGFVKALLVALAFRAVLVEPFKIPSGSMLPTLEIGDQIFINKFIYGVRIPFTNYVPFTIVRPPARGDVIVFNNPVQPDKDYVKRVIGVAGDRLTWQGKEVVINGQAQPRTTVDPAFETWDQPTAGLDWSLDWVANWFVDDWHATRRELSVEVLDGMPHSVLHASPGVGQNDTVVVPPGHVFVMGDNRDNSLDSRYALGLNRPGCSPPNPVTRDCVEFVPLGNIKGKAMIIWLSLAHGGWFKSVFGQTGLRLDRFFSPVTMCPGDGHGPAANKR